jgi:ABC-type nickel/cobalt efflux system permease component RcnA
MLISKRSRRKSDQFDSRFRDGRGGDFPLRQYLRCRDDFTSGLVHILLYVAFVVVLVMFTRAIDDLFSTHGADLNPWLRRGTLVLMGLFILSVLWRLYYKVMELREIRAEMARLKMEFRNQDQ